MWPRRLIGMLMLLAWAAMVRGDYPAGSRIAWLTDLQQGLAQARRLERPLFVYFHAQWCTWCRSYQSDTLEQPAVAGLINQRYVPVLVHADRRRDLFQRYGGRGLPFTVVLERSGALRLRFTGQLAPDTLLDVLLRPPQGPVAAQAAVLDPAAYDAWLEELYDPASRRFLNASHYGGTGKRWQPLSLIYLLEQAHWRPRLPGIYAALLEDLEDPVEGGFYFFADLTREDLASPLETSKVLSYNALVIWSLLEGYARLGDERLAQAARRALAWLEQRLWDAREGGFYAAQASDAAYHALDAAGRRRAVRPPLERVKYADANAQAALVFARAAAVLGEPRYRARAGQTLDFLERHMRAADGGYYHYREAGRNHLPGYLSDALWALAAHTAYAHGGDKAVSIVRRLLAHVEGYRDPAGGLWERRPGTTGRPWKSAASQGLYAYLVSQPTAAGWPSGHWRWAQQALERRPPASEPDDYALAMIALRRLGG
ncbi:MAG: thioredoxin family protein [Burkholderiales bacterium]|nr:thioredoxin family protein [Burkholderiales bacterium]